MPLPKHMMDDITSFFGKAGMNLQVGDETIECVPPESATECKTRDGVTLKVGDVVRERIIQNGEVRRPGWSDPVLIEAIYTDDNAPELGVHLPDDPGRLIIHWMAWRTEHPHYTDKEWHREFEVLPQADVDAWWNEKRTLKPGWHDLRTSSMEGGGRVHIGDDGVPDIVERRRDDFGMKVVVRVAEILTGYDLTIGARYDDKEKTQRKVKTAKRRSPPKIG